MSGISKRPYWKTRAPGLAAVVLAVLIPHPAACQFFHDSGPAGSVLDNATSTLSNIHITKGCDPTPDFCPGLALQRDEMAVMLVRAWSMNIWHNQDAFLTTSPPQTTPYFQDVQGGPTLPQSQWDPYFLYVQKLYELGITGGYQGPTFDLTTGNILTQGIFCPNTSDNNHGLSTCSGQGTVQNSQLAVFISRIRALTDNGCAAQYTTATVPYGKSPYPYCTPNNFSYPANAYFSDVQSGDSQFKYIQRMKQLGAYDYMYLKTAGPPTLQNYSSSSYQPSSTPACPSGYIYPCNFGESTMILRGTMAIELVAAGLTLNLPPAITGTAYSAQLQTVAGTPPFVWQFITPPLENWNTLPLPNWLTFSSTGALSSNGAVPASAANNSPYTFTAVVTDGVGVVYFQNITLTVNQPLAVLATSLPTGTVGLQYSQTLAATGGVPPYTIWAPANNTSPPSGLTLNSSGVLSGIPTGISAGSFYVTVTDSSRPLAQTSAAQVIALSIGEASFVVTTVTLPVAAVNTPYSASLSATGGVWPYSNWGAAPGSTLPGWLSLSSGGVLSGTPTSVSGSPFTFAVVAHDATGAVSPAQTLTISVGSSATSPACGGLACKEYIRLGSQLLAIENTPPPGLTVSTPSQPSGATSVTPGTAYTYSTGGAVASDGNGVQYQFTWGDQTNSGWLAPGTVSAQHSWASSGSYLVTAQARAISNNAITSSYSLPRAVSAIGVSTPTAPFGNAQTYSAGVLYTWSSNGAYTSDGSAVQYQFTWGDGTNSGWLPPGTMSAPHIWFGTGPYSVTVTAKSVSSGAMSQSQQTGVFINDSPPFLQPISPLGSSGSSQTFSTTTTDYGGWSSISMIQYWFSGSNGDCHLAYFPASNLLYLDAPYGNLGAWVGNGTVNQPGTLSNGVCSINLGSSWTSVGNWQFFSLSVAVTFITPGTYTEETSATNATGTAPALGQWMNWGNWNAGGTGNTTPVFAINLPGNSYYYTDPWTVSLTTSSSFSNQYFAQCSVSTLSNGIPTEGCTAWIYPLISGYWSESGQFNSNVVGQWIEWAELQSTVSTSISFTVYQ